MGVTKISENKFRARYSNGGVRYNVGTYGTAKEAKQALEQHKSRNGLKYENIPVDLNRVPTTPKPTQIGRASCRERV